MDLYKFEDENAVIKQAEKVINHIFSDKSYSNPQKISLLINQYQKKQIKLDYQLSKVIKSQIQCIQQSKISVLDANNYMKEADQKTEKLKQIWQEREQFHQFMQDIVNLQIFQNNIGKVIEQFSYFIDMETEMHNLQKLSEDETKYEIIGNKLLNLIQLRDALLEDSSWQRQTAMMRKEFVKVNNFQTKFFDKIFDNFNDCIKFAKQNSQTLKIAIKVIDSYDKALEAKGKEKTMKDRAFQIIRQSIQKKFSLQLQDSQDLIGIIQKAQFTTKDLVDVSDYVQPCFPKEFPIMQLYQTQYQKHIENIVFPYFDQIKQEKQYGNLVILLGWIDDYETMLARAGLDSMKLQTLKSTVQILMPHFITHNKKIVQDFIQGALKQDKKKFGRKLYEQMIREGQSLVSMFPSDIFRFINQQAQIIKDQLKGQFYYEFVKCITEVLKEFQHKQMLQIQRQWKVDIKTSDDEDEIVNFWYKVIMYINNYNQCLKYAGQSKEIFSESATEQYKNRIQKLFMNDVQKQFNYSIPHFTTIIIQIIFTNVLKEYFPNLFTLKWINDKSSMQMLSILKTITKQIRDIQEQDLIINLIHYRMVVQSCLQYIVNAYVQQMIIFIKVIYKANNNMEVRYCNYPATLKKIQIEMNNTDLKTIFNSKLNFTEAIKRDRMSFMKFADNFGQCTSKNFMDKIKIKFTIIVDIFMKKNKQFESLPAKIMQIFPEKASQLLQAILIAREDIQNRALNQPKRGMGYD